MEKNGDFVMNSFYDYMLVRIYRWYDQFKNEPSFFTAKLIVALHQGFIVFSILIWIDKKFLTLSPLSLKIISVLIAILSYARLHFRYSDEEFFKSLLKKWSKEEKKTRVIRGLAIPVIIFAPLIVFVIVARALKG